MQRKRRTSIVLALALLSSLAIGVVPATASGSDAHDYTYRVTVENLTDGQPLTPAVAAAHESGFKVFRRGQEASNGIQQLAENGGVPVLVDELSGNGNVASVAVIGSAPIAPGDSATALISTDRWHRRLSVASMLICTNDGFAGRSSVHLPSGVGNERTFYARAFDAGTRSIPSSIPTLFHHATVWVRPGPPIPTWLRTGSYAVIAASPGAAI